MKFAWVVDGAGYRAEMADNVTLFATPEYTKDFGRTPKRGTFWRAGVSQFDGKSTISRFGRDEYHVKHKTKKDARLAAESIYRDAIESKT